MRLTIWAHMGSIYEKRNKKKMSQLLWSWCGFIKMLTKQNLQRGQGHSGLGQRPYLWRACSVTQWIPWFRLMRFLSGLVVSFLFWVLSTYTKGVENISKNNTKLPKLCLLHLLIWWFWNQKRTNHSLVQFSLMWLCSASWCVLTGDGLSVYLAFYIRIWDAALEKS